MSHLIVMRAFSDPISAFHQLAFSKIVIFRELTEKFFKRRVAACRFHAVYFTTLIGTAEKPVLLTGFCNGK
jgi:hypothetical protein